MLDQSKRGDPEVILYLSGVSAIMMYLVGRDPVGGSFTLPARTSIRRVSIREMDHTLIVEKWTLFVLDVPLGRIRTAES
jgi:hypothetical protein